MRYLLLLFSLLLTLPVGWVTAQQTDPLPIFPFAAIHDDGLWLYGETAQPVETSEEVFRRPLVWSDDGEHLYFIVRERGLPVMRTDQRGTAPEIVIPRSNHWSGVDEVAGDLIYAEFNPDAVYPSHTIYPYGEDNQDIFAPVQQDVYRRPANGEPELVGSFAQGVDCQGGPPNLSHAVYMGELNNKGNPLTLRMTPHGVVHTFTCWGGGTALLTADDDVLLGNRLRRVQISENGRDLIGIDDAKPEEPNNIDDHLLRYVNLATLQSETLSTAAEPDQLAWGLPGTDEIFYSSLTPADPIELTEAEDEQLWEITYFFGDGARNMASIRRYNIETGADDVVYEADAYAIGRMALTPDGRYLLFSQIPNADDYVETALAGDFEERSDLRKLIEPNVYAFDLETGETTLLAERVYFFSFNAAAYEG